MRRDEKLKINKSLIGISKTSASLKITLRFEIF